MYLPDVFILLFNTRKVNVREPLFRWQKTENRLLGVDLKRKQLFGSNT